MTNRRLHAFLTRLTALAALLALALGGALVACAALFALATVK